MSISSGGEAGVVGQPTAAPTGLRRLWDRQLPHYPDTGARTLYLGITVLATIVLYYELYIQGAVATQIIRDLNFSFTSFVFVLVVGNAVGAFASLAAGLADRWGRANLVVGGLLITGLITLFALPNAGSKGEYYFFFALLSLVEGVALVATPALIRDFSPQVGRGMAMGFWTMGPVLGSLVVTEVSSHTLDSHPDWQYQFRIAGIVGLVVWAITLVGLRELSPRLRDQLMVSMRDRALIEARAAGIKPEMLLRHHWKQMLRFDVVGSAFAISIFLLLYYMLVAFLVVYMATVFGFSEQKANSLANYYWITNAIVLVLAGVASDAVRVRKPFMIVGGIISIIGGILFARAATHPDTSYGTLAVYFVIASFGGGMAYVTWMAGFTETVEKHNPAATATGLAVWGWILRIIVTVSFALLPVVVPATTHLVDHGPRVAEIVAKYPNQVKTLNQVDKPTLAALNKNPNDQAAQVKALSQISGLSGAEVAKTVTLSTRYQQELATAQAVDPATLQALAQNPRDQAAGQKAVGEIAQKFGISAQQATARLQALGKVPQQDLAFVAANGPKVQKAATSLKAINEVPKGDLAYLGAHGADVAKAQEDNPGQWQTWWWICVGGQILFIPFVLIMAGHWSPRKARQEEAEHEAMVQRELAALEGRHVEA